MDYISVCSAFILVKQRAIFHEYQVTCSVRCEYRALHAPSDSHKKCFVNKLYRMKEFMGYQQMGWI